MDTSCSNCNAPTPCNPGHDRWCSDLPHALPVPNQGTTGCLCRDCLTTKLDLQAVPGSATNDRANALVVEPSTGSAVPPGYLSDSDGEERGST
jgi:hypothetical protein